MSKSRIVQLLLSFAVGAACLWAAFRNVSWADAQSAVAAVPAWVYLVYLLALVCQFFLRAWRWALQVRGHSGTQPPMWDAAAINAVSFAAVFLLPFRLGEFVRPFLSARHGYMRKTTALAQSAVERILDGLVTTVCFAVVLLWLGERGLPDEVRYAGWFGLVVFGGATSVLIAAVALREPSERFWRRWIGRVSQTLADKSLELLRSFLDGVSCLQQPSVLGGYLALTVAYWLLNGWSMWWVMSAMGMEVGLAGAYFTLCFLVISVMLPAPPGNVGNFHAFSKWALILLGVAEPLALAFAVVVHICHILSLVAGAGFFLLRGDVNLAGFRKAVEGAADGP